MENNIIFTRLISFTILFLILIYTRSINGSSAKSIPYWMTVGIIFLYSCYSFSGIEFYNGNSIKAELALTFLPAIGALGFSFSSRASIKNTLIVSSIPTDPVNKIPKVSGFFILITTAVVILFFYTLTNGQPWRIITDGVALKWDRLTATTQDKNPLLIVFDAVSYSLMMIGISWSIIGYKDDNRSRNYFIFLLFLIGLYVVSTGSRTPLIGIILQIFGAVFFGHQNSRLFSDLYRSKSILWIVSIFTILFMISITYFRMEIEQLDIFVFIKYFNITDPGIIEPLSEYGSFGFFFSTIITYSASTYNNAVIRIQELDAIVPTFGYKFLFYYLYAFINPNSEFLTEWRNLATANNEYLLVMSDAATQWATVYGDAIWDFGLEITAILVLLVSYVSGFAINRASISPNLCTQLLGATIIGFSLSPLVNPFLSLHVHFMLFIIGFLYLLDIRKSDSSYNNS
jgi:hypothetical protein